MNNILKDISGKIDPETVVVLQVIKQVADSLDIDFFVVGASARDIVLEHCYNTVPRRGTKDIDIGVEVSDWNEFQKLSEALVATGKLTSDREKQRFIFNNIPIDIIPFGSISDEDKNIIWPPEHVMIMNMQGFEEAYRNAVTVRLSSDPTIDIKVPTLPGLALMKIISWNDRGEGKQKDASDLILIMNNYEHTDIEDRLYETEQYLVEDSGFDMREASIRLLGRDMARIADPDTLEKVKEILLSETEEQSNYRLTLDMISGSLENEFEEVLERVGMLLKGINDIREN